MVKRIFLSLLLLVIVTYLALAMSLFNREPHARVCQGIKLDIQDSVYAGFINRQEVMLQLKKRGIEPVGRPINGLRTDEMEEVLSSNPLIDHVECFTTPSGWLRVKVWQRIPLYRVMDVQGKSYFVDTKGETMSFQARCVARLPIVTGHVSAKMTSGELYHFVSYLNEDEFWNAQIEQIHVLKDGSVELVPRVGNHIISLGKLTQYERKLLRMKEFYRKGLNKVGWNKYSRISVEYSNQIVCTKREEKGK